MLIFLLNSFSTKRFFYFTLVSIKLLFIIRTQIEQLYSADTLRKLPELNPPKVMPAGNVGTPSKTFLALVNRCLLPPAIIKVGYFEYFSDSRYTILNFHRLDMCTVYVFCSRRALSNIVHLNKFQ